MLNAKSSQLTLHEKVHHTGYCKTLLRVSGNPLQVWPSLQTKFLQSFCKYSGVIYNWCLISILVALVAGFVDTQSYSRQQHRSWFQSFSTLLIIYPDVYKNSLIPDTKGCCDVISHLYKVTGIDRLLDAISTDVKFIFCMCACAVETFICNFIRGWNSLLGCEQQNT